VSRANVFFHKQYFLFQCGNFRGRAGCFVSRAPFFREKQRRTLLVRLFPWSCEQFPVPSVYEAGNKLENPGFGACRGPFSYRRYQQDDRQRVIAEHQRVVAGRQSVIADRRCDADDRGSNAAIIGVPLAMGFVLDFIVDGSMTMIGRTPSIVFTSLSFVKASLTSDNDAAFSQASQRVAGLPDSADRQCDVDGGHCSADGHQCDADGRH